MAVGKTYIVVINKLQSHMTIPMKMLGSQTLLAGDFGNDTCIGDPFGWLLQAPAVLCIV